MSAIGAWLGFFGALLTGALIAYVGSSPVHAASGRSGLRMVRFRCLSDSMDCVHTSVGAQIRAIL